MTEALDLYGRQFIISYKIHIPIKGFFLFLYDNFHFEYSRRTIIFFCSDFFLFTLKTNHPIKGYDKTNNAITNILFSVDF